MLKLCKELISIIVAKSFSCEFHFIVEKAETISMFNSSLFNDKPMRIKLNKITFSRDITIITETVKRSSCGRETT